jgi:hypothetical protein
VDLLIYTGATDVTNSAVTSVTDDTPVSELKQLFTGDDEPLSIQFTDGAAAPAWASDATYVLTVALGVPTPGGLLELASTSTFTLNASTRTGSLDLSTAPLTDYLRTHLCGRRTGLGLSLQLRIATPAGKAITYAQLPVVVQAAVVA